MWAGNHFFCMGLQDIATYSEKIDAISTRRWERDELKERLQRKVWNIQGYKKALTKIHQEIADIVARIERLGEIVSMNYPQ